jgi:DNA-binding transcriptional regulator YdaS (Cro superfamily)
MNKKEAIKHFGSQKKLAKELGITSEAISQWGEIPPLRVFQIKELIAKGKFLGNRNESK